MVLAAALEELCRICVERLPVDGAVIHLMTNDSVVGVAAASDFLAATQGDLPFVTGEGPCLDAHKLNRPVLIPDLAMAMARWPGYSVAMLEHDVRAVSSIPLLVGAVNLGVLDLYAARVGSLDREDLAVAMTMGIVATDLLLTGGTVDEALDVLGEVVDHRAEIYQAQGALVVTLGIPLLDAMARMRAHAFAVDLPLIELARMVLLDASAARDW